MPWSKRIERVKEWKDYAKVGYDGPGLSWGRIAAGEVGGKGREDRGVEDPLWRGLVGGAESLGPEA